MTREMIRKMSRVMTGDRNGNTPTTGWHAVVEVNQPTLDDDQIDTLTDELPGYATLTHNADRGRLSMRFIVDAATLRQAIETALRATRRACGVAFGSKVPELIQIRVLPVDDQMRELEYPQPEDLVGYANLRSSGVWFAQIIDTYCPDSREKALALTKLEEAVMWANAAIARNE